MAQDKGVKRRVHVVVVVVLQATGTKSSCVQLIKECHESDKWHAQAST
jgi:hypothetical protein